MHLVVVEDVPDHLVEHGEEGPECPQAGEVHDVVQGLCMLQSPHHQPIRREVGDKEVCTVVLDLGGGGEGREGRGGEGRGGEGGEGVGGEGREGKGGE